ncbi:hypothetical protein V1525DRAFT_414317 [Lipomyces kononenkoae]|uniref:Uncharacterized protein n=1 Tax=Lipomyces kononenkoae TaxID=34357 RepID=A0ACC3SR21_LIPKO
MGLLRIIHWATGDQCENNPRMQRDLCDSIIRSPQELINKLKRPYEEALGFSRPTGHTMRKAPKSYYYMGPNNDYVKDN